MADDAKGIAKAGRLLCLDHGEYGDYTVDGFFVVLRDFDPMAELREHLEAHPDQRADYSFERAKFVAGLLARGLLMEVEYGTLYLGSYSKATGDDGVRFWPGRIE